MFENQIFISKYASRYFQKFRKIICHTSGHILIIVICYTILFLIDIYLNINLFYNLIITVYYLINIKVSRFLPILELKYKYITIYSF